MTIIKKTFTINATPADIWNAISNFGEIDLYHPEIVKSWLTSDIKSGPGTTRECTLANGGRVVEQVTEWQPHKKLAVELLEMTMPFKSASGFTEIVPITGTTTEITIGMEFKVKYGFPGELIGQVMKPLFYRMFRRTALSLEFFIHNGKKMARA